MADRITINAGGRRFETSTTTLIGSGAGYFEALLGETGRKLRGRKRARAPEVTGAVDDDDAPGTPREMFIDRDPDVFADVLRYMRANRLPAAAAADTHRLEDLKTEAEFFCYDRLAAACDEAIEALTPRCLTLNIEACVKVDADGTDRRPQNVMVVDVPKGQVLHIVSVMPTYGEYNRTYGLSATNDEEDVQRSAACFARGVLDLGKSYDRTKPRITMDGGKNGKVHLAGFGADFSLIAWVGPASKIPGLGATKD